MADLSESLSEIDSGIRRLKIDFDRFFNGALPIPPEDQRRRVTRLLRRARSAPNKSFADRFLLNTLEARFNTLSELFNRRLREQEVAATPRGQRSPSRPDPSRGVVLGARLDPDAVDALYRTLYSREGRGAKTDYASFERYLRKQVDALRKKTGCREIRFRVTEAGGVPKLRAKPLVDK